MLSNKAIFQISISIFLGCVLFGVVLMSINSTLSCVDKNGCLRSWCKWEWLGFDYQVQISKLSKSCPFQTIGKTWNYPPDLRKYITGK